MSSYQSLAKYYDRLTSDVPYPLFADFYENVFRQNSSEISLILDLCCGTGSLSFELSKRGYDIISVDKSYDMLAAAQVKCSGLNNSPLFICQDASELDLYGTVDAAVSSLDSINYISPSKISEVFHKLSLFIKPGGTLIFDIRSEDYLQSLNGSTSIDEDESIFCVWRSDLLNNNCIRYGIDLFIKNGSFWKRYQEEHLEYLYSLNCINSLLIENQFSSIKPYYNVIPNQDGRIFITANRL